MTLYAPKYLYVAFACLLHKYLGVKSSVTCCKIMPNDYLKWCYIFHSHQPRERVWVAPSPLTLPGFFVLFRWYRTGCTGICGFNLYFLMTKDDENLLAWIIHQYSCFYNVSKIFFDYHINGLFVFYFQLLEFFKGYE